MMSLKKRDLIYWIFLFILSVLMLVYTLKKEGIIERLIPQRIGQIKIKNTLPVTHTWYSSLFFQDQAYPLYALPLSFKVSEDRIEISYPEVNFYPKSIQSAHFEELIIKHETGEKILVEQLLAGENDVSLNMTSEEGEFRLKIVKGYPGILVDNIQGFLKVEGKIKKISELRQGLFLIETEANNRYLAMGDFFTQDNKTLTTTASNQSFNIILLPEEVIPTNGKLNIEQILSCSNPPEETIFDFRLSENKINYFYKASEENDNFLTVVLPHVYSNVIGFEQNYHQLGIYKTIRGEAKLVCAQNLNFDLETLEFEPDFNKFIDQEKLEDPLVKQAFDKDYQQLISQDEPTGVYFEGKLIKNLLDIYELSKLLKDKPRELALKLRIETRLLKALNKFSFDKKTGLVHSEKPEYGSEFGNDHHFQHSYYIASFARFFDSFDEDSKIKVKALMDQFVTEGLPGLESFGYPKKSRFMDSFEAHSWADARALSNYGNNQQSTSEALYYWYSLWLWGYKTQDPILKDQAKAFFYLELEGARKYWFLEDNAYLQSNFSKPLVPIIRGGKLDYSTLFSTDEDKILAIQILPINPSSFISLNMQGKPMLSKLVSYYDQYIKTDTKNNFYEYYLFFKLINNLGAVEPTPTYQSEFISKSLLTLLKSQNF